MTIANDSHSVEDLYQEIILDHARSPRHAGLRETYQSSSHQVNPTCGDEIELRLALRGGLIDDISYETLGCAISQASASVMTELLIGQPVDEGLRRQEAFVALMQSRGTEGGDEDVLGDAVAFAGVSRYPARVKCALLAWMAWKDALGRLPDESTRGPEQTAPPSTATSPGVPA